MGFFSKRHVGKKSHVDMRFSHVNLNNDAIFFPTWRFEKILCQHGAPFPDEPKTHTRGR
jgi:hypothetical protein